MSAGRRWLWPLVPAYSAAVAAGNALRVAGVIPVRELGWPVLSVGSLSAGGAGKTPVVIALARLMAARGWCLDVLSRGYGRKGRGVEQVNPALAGAAERFGDEPVLVAERAGVPVWVGSSRYAAGRQAEAHTLCDPLEQETAKPTFFAHLLDDGMQHRGLRRQFELVLVTAQDLGDSLLPAGNLREPLAALRRADAFAVREDELEAVGPQLRTLCGREIPVWTVRRTLHFPGPLGVFGAGLRPLAFCGLARPEGFAAMLTGAGCGIVDTVLFPDHHRYGEREATELVRLARGLNASGLVTTEKDAVKLTPALRARLEAQVGPLMVTPLEASFVYESPVVRALEACFRPLRRAADRPGVQAR